MKTNQLPPHTITINDHPEPHIMQWSDLELAAIKKYAECYALQARAMLAQQPAMSEPVLTVEKEPDYWSNGHFYKGKKPHINPIKVWSLPIGTKLYTRPAPSVPALIEKAISSGHFGVLPMKATIPMCKAGWGASGGELTFQELGRIYEEMYKARPLPAADIDVAKEAP